MCFAFYLVFVMSFRIAGPLEGSGLRLAMFRARRLRSVRSAVFRSGPSATIFVVFLRIRYPVLLESVFWYCFLFSFCVQLLCLPLVSFGLCIFVQFPHQLFVWFPFALFCYYCPVAGVRRFFIVPDYVIDPFGMHFPCDVGPPIFDREDFRILR